MATLEVLLQNFLKNIEHAALIFSSFDIYMYNVHNRYVLGAWINLEILRYGTAMTSNLETSWYISIYCFILMLVHALGFLPFSSKGTCFLGISSHHKKHHQRCVYDVSVQFSSQNKTLAGVISQLAFFLLDGHPAAFDRPHWKSSKMFTFWLATLILLSPVVATDPSPSTWGHFSQTD